jgi:hypothetical protein
MFTVAGISRQNGSLKLRFANDFVTRCKVLARNGHKDINLVELPQAMTKDAAVAYISTLPAFSNVDSQAVISQFAGEKAPKRDKLVEQVKREGKQYETMKAKGELFSQKAAKAKAEKASAEVVEADIAF